MSKSPWENEAFARESLDDIDRRFLQGTTREVDFLVQELDICHGDSVLDLGCGAGRHSIELARRGFAVTGLDISETLLEEAGDRASRAGIEVELIRCDLASLAETLAGRESFYRGVVCICESGFGVLGEEGDLEFLRSVRSLLAPGSKLVLTTYNGIRRYRSAVSGDSGFDYLTGTMAWKTPENWSGGDQLAEIDRIYVPSEMGLLCRSAGFGDVEVTGCAPGDFRRQPLQPHDVEMMVIATKSGS